MWNHYIIFFNKLNINIFSKLNDIYIESTERSIDIQFIKVAAF